MPREQDKLNITGVTHYIPERFRGYLGLYPFDTIIEEIESDSSVIEISSTKTLVKQPEEKETYLSLEIISSNKTKKDIISQLSKKLSISEKEIFILDEKPRESIFTQRVYIHGVDKNKAAELDIHGILVKSIRAEKENQKPRRPLGNQYTLLVRTDSSLDEEKFLEHIARVETRGIYNFYHYERFDKRLIGHIVGKYILQGNYKKAVYTILFEHNQFDLRIVSPIRKRAEQAMPNLLEVDAIFNEQATYTKLERRIISYLKKNPKDYVGALKYISQYTRSAIRCFSMYLFNTALSNAIADNAKIYKELPLFPSSNTRENNVYADILRSQEIPENLTDTISAFNNSFSPYLKAFRPTRISISFNSVTIIPDGVILSFTLPRETHLKTVLNNLFILMQKGRTPSWVSAEKYDILQTLGKGNAGQLLKKLTPN